MGLRTTTYEPRPTITTYESRPTNHDLRITTDEPRAKQSALRKREPDRRRLGDQEARGLFSRDGGRKQKP